MTWRMFYILCRLLRKAPSLVNTNSTELYTKPYKPKRLWAWIDLYTLYRKDSCSNNQAERTGGYGVSGNLFYRSSCLSFNKLLIFLSLKFLSRMKSLLGVSCVCSWLVGRRAYFLQASCLTSLRTGNTWPHILTLHAHFTWITPPHVVKSPRHPGDVTAPSLNCSLMGPQVGSLRPPASSATDKQVLYWKPFPRDEYSPSSNSLTILKRVCGILHHYFLKRNIATNRRAEIFIARLWKNVHWACYCLASCCKLR
jgi:hypothetical protein